MQPPNTAHRRTFLRGTLGTALAATVGIGTTTAQPDPPTVTFDDQDAKGVTVAVDEVHMPDGGFVVIHDDRLLNGDALASVVGHTAYKQSGTHTDLRISVDPKQIDPGDNLLIAMPHRNTNTSRKYDFVTSGGQYDGPYFDSNNNVVIDPATVTF